VTKGRFARGDLSKKVAVEVKGENLELKNTVNTRVDQLQSFASEVTRVAARSARGPSWEAQPTSATLAAPGRISR